MNKQWISNIFNVKYLLLNIFLLIIFSNSLVLRGGNKDSIFNSYIGRFIENSNGKYKYIDIKKYDLRWKEFSNSTSPFIIEGNFNGDSLIDYSILIENKVITKIELICFINTKGSFNMYSLDTFDYKSIIDIVLNIESRGLWESIDEKINTRFDGITVELFNESLSFSYYWDENKFKKFYWD